MGEEKSTNLKPLTSELAREYGRRGGLAKAENARVRKAIELIVDGKTPAKLQGILKSLGIKNPKKMSYIESLIQYANFKAFSKNTKLSEIIKLLEFIRDGLGEMPTQKHEVENTGINIIVADKEHQKMLEDL